MATLDDNMAMTCNVNPVRAQLTRMLSSSCQSPLAAELNPTSKDSNMSGIGLSVFPVLT